MTTNEQNRMFLVVDSTVLNEVLNGNFQFQNKPRDENNRPEFRRNQNLATLLMAGFQPVATGPIDLDFANCVHLPRYTNFLKTIWERSREDPKRFEETYGDDSDDEGEVAIAAWTFTKDNLPKQNSWKAELLAFSADDGAIFSDTADALSTDMGVVQGAVNTICDGNHAFALVTHPGHHAGRSTHGGYCFLNNAAIAAKLLSEKGKKVGIIDVDYHGGNGTYELLSELENVEFVSLHAEDNYPWVEMGKHGRNLEAGTSWEEYKVVLGEVLEDMQACDVLVVSMGFDVLDSDPVAEDHAFAISTEDFKEMGELFASHGAQILFVQEGGYDMESVPKAAKNLVNAFTK